MADDKSTPENLVLEHLRHIRATVDRTDERLTRVEIRLTGVERHMATMLDMYGSQNERLDSLEARQDGDQRLRKVDVDAAVKGLLQGDDE